MENKVMTNISITLIFYTNYILSCHNLTIRKRKKQTDFDKVLSSLGESNGA